MKKIAILLSIILLFPVFTSCSNESNVQKNDDLITGSLYLINKYGDSVEPTQETFNTDFYLVWVE